jgi:putative serine protease PepD
MVRRHSHRDGISWTDVDNVALVSDTPEEPRDGDPGPDEGGAGPDGLESAQRGWIDPDDRLWRHPSEVAGPAGAGSGGGPGEPPESPVLLNAPPRHPYRSAFMVLVGVAAMAAVVAWVVVLLSPASQHPSNGAGSAGDTVAGGVITTLAGQQVPAVVETAGRSLVELEATTDHGTVALIGVAVAEGGLVATTAGLLQGATHVTMVGSDGKVESASVVATDPDSGVALIDVPEDLPVAPFADATTLAGGAPDYTLSYVPAGGSGVALHCTPGSVTTVGDAIAAGPAAGMPSITTSAGAPASTTAGAVLVTAGGSVAGLLYEPTAGTTSSATTYLPSQLVVGVANDLRSGDRVVPGWLGVQGSDAPDDGGAKVETVSAGSPAATGKLASGQVVTAVNSLPVHTMAELRARIYVLPPGSAITLSVQQATGTRAVGVTLGKAT